MPTTTRKSHTRTIKGGLRKDGSLKQTRKVAVKSSTVKKPTKKK
jgi:hypothetical protein